MRGGSGLACEVIEGNAYVSLLPDKSVAGREGLWKPKKAPEGYEALPTYIDGASPSDVEDAPDPLTRACAMNAYAEQQEAEERRRLLYVALTRAKEALVFAMTTTSRASGFTSGADFGVYDDVRSALCGVEDFAAGDTLIEFGGSAPALVSRIDATEADIVDYLGESALYELMPNAQIDGCVEGGAATSDCSEEPLATSFAIPDLDACCRGSLAEAPWRSSRVDVTSYSAIAQGEEHVAGKGDACAGSGFACDEDDAFWDALCASLAADADKATDVGTAFHLLAQRMVEGRQGGAFVAPDENAIDCISARLGLGGNAKNRLGVSLHRWASSEAASDVASHPIVRAEVPFFVEMGADLRPKPFYLEGSIDLLACDAWGEGVAYIVDYKTGGSPDESADALRAKHELQASCYAYAALLQGFETVDATFVRVEQEDREYPGQPQCVSYRFTAGDLSSLEARVVQAYGKSVEA